MKKLLSSTKKYEATNMFDFSKNAKNEEEDEKVDLNVKKISFTLPSSKSEVLDI